GGGFGIGYESGPAPPVEAFARAAAPYVSGIGLELVVEPGRFIAGNAGILVTRVIDVKRSGGKRFVIVDAGMNDLIRPSLYKSFHRAWPVRSNLDPRDEAALGEATGLERADIVGPTCESGRLLPLARGLPRVGRGH